MGHRANFIIVNGDGYELYYSHWAANALPQDFFWGPTHALAFVRAQRPVGEDGWLDDIWAEGGALIEPGARVLRLFGGEDLQYDVLLRRLYLSLLADVWNEWDVGWAHEGIADLADHVGYPRDRVLSGRTDEPRPVDLSPPAERDWLDLVGSARMLNGAIRLFPLAGYTSDYLLAGPALADASERSPSLDRLDVAAWMRSFPTSGFHIDFPDHALRFWDTRDQPGIMSRVVAKWPGWIVRWDRDGYEAQLAEVGEFLSFPDRPTEVLLRELTEILLYEAGRSPAETVLWFAEQQQAEGQRVEVNPFALRDDRLEVPRQMKADILAGAIARLGLHLSLGDATATSSPKQDVIRLPSQESETE